MYEPSDDSFLLAKTITEKIPELIKKNPNLRVLEIGIGSGIQLEALEKSGIKKDNILGVDINNNAVRLCNEKGFYCVKSDLFSNIKPEKKADIILFNPPYLPKDKKEPVDSEKETTGGIRGGELINRFLEQAKNYLKPSGKIFLLTSSLTKGINWKSWKVKKIAEKKLFFEKLFVWELEKN